MGVSLEAEDTGLLEEEVAMLQNHGEEADEFARISQKRNDRNNRLMEIYAARQPGLEDRASQNCENPTPPAVPKPLYHPRSWLLGIDESARAQLAAYQSANPDGMQQETEGVTVNATDGSLLRMSPAETAALRVEAREMLQHSGFIPSADEDENGEVEGGKGPPEVMSLLSEVGTRAELIGFMIFCGAVPKEPVTEEEQLEVARKQREEQREQAARDKWE